MILEGSVLGNSPVNIWKQPEQKAIEMILMPFNSERYYESQKKSLEESKGGNTAKFA